MENMMDKIWKPIIGFEGIYSVSEFGDVRRDKTGRILKQEITRTGYLRIDIGKKIRKQISRLVIESFLGPRPEGMFCNHIDGDKTNNHISNLEYVTQSDNEKHAYRIGLRISRKGEDSHLSKLTKNDVLEIRKLYIPFKNGCCRLSKKFNVSEKCILSIIKRKTWKHI